MGLELMGFAVANAAELWIDPFDYQQELREAVFHLAARGMNVSVYNDKEIQAARSRGMNLGLSSIRGTEARIRRLGFSKGSSEVRGLEGGVGEAGAGACKPRRDGRRVVLGRRDGGRARCGGGSEG